MLIAGFTCNMDMHIQQPFLNFLAIAEIFFGDKISFIVTPKNLKIKILNTVKMGVIRMRKMVVFICILLMTLSFSTQTKAVNSPAINVFIDNYDSNSVIYSLEIEIPTDSYIFKDIKIQVNGTGFNNFVLSQPELLNGNSSDHTLRIWEITSSKINDVDRDGLVHVAGIVSAQYRTCTDTSFLYCSAIHRLKLNYGRDILLPVEFSNRRITFSVRSNKTIYEGKNLAVRIIVGNANSISALVHYKFDAAIGNTYGSIHRHGKIIIPPHSEKELMFKVWYPVSGTYGYSVDISASRVGESGLWSVGHQNSYVMVLKKPQPVVKSQSYPKIGAFHYRSIFPR